MVDFTPSGPSPPAHGANWDYRRLRPVGLPLALARLHQSLAVGGTAHITVAARDDRVAHLKNVLLGAGFRVKSVVVEHNQVRARVTRLRTLPDFVGPNMRLLVCGLNPSLFAADAGVGFARPGNRFWPAALAAGLVPADRDPWAALQRGRVGFTDLVKRSTVAADEVTKAEYQAGAYRLAWMLEWLQPAAVCFVGLAGWRAVVDQRATSGPQPQGFAGVAAYLMPSTSGRNARTRVDALTEHLRAAARLAGGATERR